MLKSLYGLIWIAAVAGYSVWAHAEIAEDLSVVVLFDRSASMAKDMGGSTRIDLARDAFNNWSATLAGRSNVAVRFFAGGVNKNNIATNCEASELVIPFGRDIDTADIASLSAGVRAIGRKTNIAYAL
ncbi:MAG: VWA domain-containing protein, partial [Halieaceae bacterium]|nr:VWA domain-containing protein [Halieaceae bacterium]